MDDLDKVLQQLDERRRAGMAVDNLFVLVLERTPQGQTRLVSYGLKTIGELAAYIAVNQQSSTERKFA